MIVLASDNWVGMKVLNSCLYGDLASFIPTLNYWVKIALNSLLTDTFNCKIKYLSLSLCQFQELRELSCWKDILTKGVIEIIFYIQTSQLWYWHEDDSNSTTSFEIYLSYMLYKVYRYYQIGVGYCFIRAIGNAKTWM